MFLSAVASRPRYWKDIDIMSGYVNARFDFAERATASKLVVVASSYRSGSTYVALSLWSDGRFGAPFEYFNFEKDMDYMMARLRVDDIEEYLRQLIRLRTSSNGVFGIKAHFHHFEWMLGRSSVLRENLKIARFVYVNRKNKIAQAVSMARALQDNAWISFSRPRQAPVFYSKELIEECLRELMVQSEGWWKWFNANQIQPFVVNYEEFVADANAHVAKIAKWSGVDGDVADVVNLPMIDRQSDALNREWTDRFLAERKLGGRGASINTVNS
jgi:trehalose 2-sulfotransferase